MRGSCCKEVRPHPEKNAIPPRIRVTRGHDIVSAPPLPCVVAPPPSRG
jgi:hypothetical protein